MKNILVIGADGFSSSHLLPVLRGEGCVRIAGTLLKENPAERWLDRTFRGDVLDGEFLRKVVRRTDPDYVYHLAAVVPIMQVRKDFPRALRVNVEGTWNLLEAVIEEAPKARILAVGSSDVYGARGVEEMPLREVDSFSPVNAYGVTKVAQEMVARLFQRERELQVLFSRTFNFTGPGQPHDFVCSSFARQVDLCRRRGGGTIRVGNLEVHRDFLDIRDVVAAYRVILEKGTPGGVYNVCSGEPVSLRWILDTLIAMAGVPVTIERDDEKVRKADIPYQAGCNERLRGLGWERKYDLEDTLADLLRSWEGREK